MSHKVEILEGALIISDAHYSQSRPELFDLIQELYLQKISTPQLILMGDIFDNLFGGIAHTYVNNQTMLDMLNEISLHTKILYLEGNHDFQLQKLLPNVKVVSIQNQPLECDYKGKKIVLAHGDFDGALGYKIYTYLIRNTVVLFFLKYIDILTNHSILNFVDNHLQKKDDCKEFIGLEKYMKNRLSGKFECDYFIEGHYHQNRSLDFEDFRYINLAAFACNQRYFIVKSLEDKELLEEIIFSKGM